ncbi:MAG: NAD(P)/FAD-dependent oxidoreductase [Janthinobacterium lividum]
MDHIETVVIGAGVVGLAVAAALAARGHEVLILEAERAIGTGTSSRNSEVLHAGLYYPSESLKARLCIAGNARLYAYAQARHIDHRRCGKLIVASHAAQIPRLEQIAANARGSGVDTLDWLDPQAARWHEPALACAAALRSPTTGIIDSHALMLSLLADAENRGATLALDALLLRASPDATGLLLEVGSAAAPERPPTRVHAQALFNCAGLHAQRLAACIDGLSPGSIPPTFYAKGRYFSCARKPPFSHLIYPVPEDGGLGVHLTLDLAGQARFGPDVEWIDAIEYGVDPRAADGFYAAIRQYWPDLPDHTLQPAYAGIRPKLTGPGAPAADFRIDGPDVHGVAGLVNLFGIESPGLTASLALADHAVACWPG